MKDTKKEPKELIDDYDYLANAASAMDFTGLIPSLPQNDAEIESTTISASFFPSRNLVRIHQNLIRIPGNNSTKPVRYCNFSLFLPSLNVIINLL